MSVDVPASLIGDPTRASFLLALEDKDALPLSELARLAGVGNSAASIQLGKLVDAGLLSVERQGRHRYFRLASADVATALRALAAIAPARDGPASAAANGIGAARTCYDHLAGALGVSLLDGLRRERIVRITGSQVELTRVGLERLEPLGVELMPTRRPLTRLCLDWTERRYHLAGALGAALTRRFFELRWIERADGRAVRLTTRGRSGLRSLGLEA